MNPLKFIAIFLSILLIFPQASFSKNAEHLVISEVVFGNENSKDEFVEIYNPTDQDINLKEFGLKLHIRNSSGSKDSNKTLEWNNEIIPANGYFLFASKTSSTYLEIADALYSADLVSNGAVYISTSKTKMTDVIDFIAWGKHSLPEGYETQISNTFSSGQSIERNSNENGVEENAGNSWDTDGNDFIIQEKPHPQNSSYTLPVIIEPLPESPIISEQIEEDVSETNNSENLENISEENTESNEESIEIINNEPTEITENLVASETVKENSTEEIIENTTSNDAEENLDNITLDTAIETESTGNNNEEVATENTQEDIVETQEESINENPITDESEALEYQIWISEIFPKPRDTNPEWIELYNPDDKEFESKGSLLCIRDMCITLNENIPAKSYYVVSETDTEKFIGTWPNLVNTSADIIWKIGDDTIDSFSYESAKISQSFIKNTKNDIVQITSHITQGKDNSFNQNPIGVIYIQGSGEKFGTAPFSFNVNGEGSYDLDNDTLTFFWDFGNGETSEKENPLAIKYEHEGHYEVSLEVNDGLGGKHKSKIDLIISPKPQVIIRSSHSSSPLKKSELSLKNSIPQRITQNNKDVLVFSKVSVNDKENDFLEISCKKCSRDISLHGHYLYDDKNIFQFETKHIVKKGLPLKIYFHKEEEKFTKENELYIKNSGLTKTDEQIILFNTNNYIVDAVCWNNFDKTFSESEKKEEGNLRTSGAWKGKCIDSKSLEKKGALLVRDMNKNDTNAKEDWRFVMQDLSSPFAEKKILRPAQDDTAEAKYEHKGCHTEPVEVCTDRAKKPKDDILATHTLSYEGLIISEFVPNPKGNDTAFEWIEIKNISDKDINIQDWTIEGRSKKYTFKKQILKAGEFFILERNISKIALANKNAWLILKNPKEKIIQNISYNEVFESASYAINEKEIFQWTSVKSPGRENTFFPVEEKSKDSDKDGLSDFLEEILGTDMNNKDSDGDKIPDKFEVEKGLDPLVKDEENRKLFKKHLLKKTQAKIKIPKTNNDTLKISGNTEPFAKIKILVHSDPHYFLTQADKNGKWEYEVKKLEKGEHTYQYQIFDDSGLKSEYSEPISFKLEEDIVVLETIEIINNNCHSREGGNPLGDTIISSNCPSNEPTKKINEDISDILEYQKNLQASDHFSQEDLENTSIASQIKKSDVDEIYNEETPWHLNPNNFQSFSSSIIPQAQAKSLLRNDYTAPPSPSANAWTYLSLALSLLNFASIGFFWMKLNERVALVSFIK
ncbi:hypothetical protein HON22_02035 [Candidatus Peregrinibacteria bacterium]|jgi:PKD repeat protein|nr:hypothetical protein [Candidatus Peregrinibacteria bacterium]